MESKLALCAKFPIIYVCLSLINSIILLAIEDIAAFSSAVTFEGVIGLILFFSIFYYFPPVHVIVEGPPQSVQNLADFPQSLHVIDSQPP